MAWGAWYRTHPGGHDLGRISKFFVTSIINPITRNLIAEALKTYEVPDGQRRVESVPEWPGLTFSIESEEGAAMLGE